MASRTDDQCTIPQSHKLITTFPYFTNYNAYDTENPFYIELKTIDK